MVTMMMMKHWVWWRHVAEEYSENYKDKSNPVRSKIMTVTCNPRSQRLYRHFGYHKCVKAVLASGTSGLRRFLQLIPLVRKITRCIKYSHFLAWFNNSWNQPTKLPGPKYNERLTDGFYHETKWLNSWNWAAKLA